MAPNPNPGNDGFEETAELPRGRKARDVPESVLKRLADSAARNVAFTKQAAPDEIEKLRRDLGSAAVRAKYIVTVATEKVNDTLHKLTFSAKTKPTETPAENAGK